MPNGCTCNPSRPPPSYHTKEAINTADVTHKELQAARKAAGLYQHQVAYLLHVSEDVVSDWETGKTLPTPDQVDELERLYKTPALWHGWMRFQYKSYRDRYPESPATAALAVSMMNAKYQLADVLEKQERAIRDALDGTIDDKKGFADYMKEAKEAYTALGEMLARAEMENPA